ncbi:MAG: hypothetical protein EAY68_00045 [Bacteroidetes bacterium]|nr:MAG: hypothetical protein EAY68_00045 [Bacteroidota bacterium]
MKWNNETKIGVLAVVAISLFYIGFKYIKGINLFQRGNFVYVSYTDTKGLLPSNPVMANGLQVGAVYDIEPNGTKLDKLVVAIKLNGTLLKYNWAIALLILPKTIPLRELLMVVC